MDKKPLFDLKQQSRIDGCQPTVSIKDKLGRRVYNRLGVGFLKSLVECRDNSTLYFQADKGLASRRHKMIGALEAPVQEGSG